MQTQDLGKVVQVVLDGVFDLLREVVDLRLHLGGDLVPFLLDPAFGTLREGFNWTQCRSNLRGRFGHLAVDVLGCGIPLRADKVSLHIGMAGNDGFKAAGLAWRMVRQSRDCGPRDVVHAWRRLDVVDVASS